MAWQMKESVPKRCPSCGRQDRFTASRTTTFMFLGIETCCEASRTPFRRLMPHLEMVYVPVDFDRVEDFITAWKFGVPGAQHAQVKFPWNPFPTGTFAIEGPHYPRLHTWAVVAEVMRGQVKAIRERLQLV